VLRVNIWIQNRKETKGSRNLLKKKLHGLTSLSDIRTMRSITTRPVGNVGHIGDMRYAHKILLEGMKVRERGVDVAVESGVIVSKQISE
jgi:hypothetical protein